MESNQEEQILTPNTILHGQDSNVLGEVDELGDGDEDSKLNKRLSLAWQLIRSRWQGEFIRSLL